MELCLVRDVLFYHPVTILESMQELEQELSLQKMYLTML